MKRIILLIIGAFLTIYMYGQNYFPLIEEDKEWSVLNEVFHIPPDPSFYTTQNFKVIGDTNINSLFFKKLYMSNEQIPTSWNLSYLIREDTNKRIWLRGLSNEDEFLLYDFSVVQGDSIQVGYFEPIYLHVDSISSIMINSSLRKKYWMSYNGLTDYQETWIEGLGSDKGIIWSGSALLIGGWTYLLCVHQNDELIYMNPDYNVCYLLTSNITEITKEQIQIYPNPAKNNLTIISPESIKIESIALHDLMGQQIIEFEPVSLLLDISHLSSGIYLLKISYNNEQIVKKIIVE